MNALNVILCFLLFSLKRCLAKLANEDSWQLLLATQCGAMLKSTDAWDQATIKMILPTVDFFEIFNNSSLPIDVLLVDVDKLSWILLVNLVAGLRKINADIPVYAVAYDSETCAHLSSWGISCYYNAEWVEALRSAYVHFTNNRRSLNEMHAVMMGRMATSMAMVCAGINVFLTDTDLVFFRNPLDYAFRAVDIMVTATPIDAENSRWGGKFFTSQPAQYFTLNNGVVFFRSSSRMCNFLVSLAASSANSLRGGPDWEKGFLQTTFNGLMNEHKLKLSPCSELSPVGSFSLPAHGNVANDCFDCHYGSVAWHSSVVTAPLPSGEDVLAIGVFPLQRYVSLCILQTLNATDAAQFHRSLALTTAALSAGDSTDWGWGALAGGASRVLSLHANCIEGGWGDVRYHNKIKWLRHMKVWYGPDPRILKTFESDSQISDSLYSA